MLLILSAMMSFAKNSITTVYRKLSYYGFNPTYLTGNNSAEPIEFNCINIERPQGSCIGPNVIRHVY